MSRATPPMRDLARRLIAGETNQERTSPGVIGPPAFAVCEKLGPHLATLMGRGGYHALLSRALVLSQPEVVWLRSVDLTEAGVLRIAEDVLKKVSAKELTVGSRVLAAELLGLLGAFIGENLTVRLVRDVWPTLSLEDLNFTKGDRP